MACSPDSKTMISAGYENLIVWDLNTGRQQMKMPGHEYDVTAVSYSPDGSLVLSGGQDNFLMIWESKTGQPKAKLQGHTDEVTAAIFSNDGNMFASSSKDKSKYFDEQKPAVTSATVGVLLLLFVPLM